MTNDNNRGRAAALYVLGESLETSSAVAFTLCMGLHLLGQKLPGWPEWRGWFIAVLLLFFGVAARFYGSVLESRAETERKSSKHEITERRLKTLEAVGVEEDILDVLSLRLGQPALPVDELITWLEGKIGRERAQERLADVLRYTRTLPETVQQQPRDAHQQRAEVPST